MHIPITYIPQTDELVDTSIWFDDGAIHLTWKPF